MDILQSHKRRDNGTTIVVQGKTIDNTWIVPCSPYLSLKYNCHINVESFASVRSVKYFFKYLYKGHDCANVRIAQSIIYLTMTNENGYRLEICKCT